MMEPTIETERLILRRPVISDLDGWAGFASDPEVMRFLGGPQPRSLAWRAMAGTAGSWALLGFGMFSVIERDSGRWIGRLGPIQPEGWPGPEIGWGLIREAQGKGYAAEGAAAAIDFAIDHLGWSRFIHCIDPENLASAAVATRLGSTKLGPGQLPPPHESETIELWGQTAAEWRERRIRNAR